MAAGFGFSVGDLIAGLRLLSVSFEAVRGAQTSNSDYASLLSELNSLRLALEAIDDLQLEHRGTEKQTAAIQRSVTSCRECIDDFLAQIAKYQPHLQQGGRGGWAAGYRKIKWAVCRQEDVAKFRAKLERHTSSINMLLFTFQVKENMGTSVGKQTQGVGTGSEIATASPIMNSDSTLQLLKGLTLEQRQFFQLLIHQNQELHRSLEDIRTLLQVQVMIPP